MSGMPAQRRQFANWRLAKRHGAAPALRCDAALREATREVAAAKAVLGFGLELARA